MKFNDDKALSYLKKLMEEVSDYKTNFLYINKGLRIKTMSDFINHFYKNSGYNIYSVVEETTMSGIYTYSTYRGKSIKIYENDKEIFSFSNNFSEPSVEVAEFIVNKILSENLDTLNLMKRNFKINKILK